MWVFWNSPDTDVRGYILELGLNEDNIYQRIELPATEESYTFSGMTRGVDYFVRLKAYDEYLNVSEPAVVNVAFYEEGDRDADGLPDWWEEYHFGSIEVFDGRDDPDEDLLNNSEELDVGTNPNLVDTDGDHLSDYLERWDARLDPLSAADLDGDRIADDWERYYFEEWDPKVLPGADNDEDELANLAEFRHGTNPLSADTDGGGVTDGDEVAYGTDPLSSDDDYYPAHTIVLRQGWNLISLPVQLRENAVSSVFPLSLATYIYDTEEGRYIEANSVEPGRSYFVLSEVDTSYTVLSMPLDGYEIDVHPGWNMIGSIYGVPVAVDAISSAPEGLILPGSLYRYNTESGRYVSSYEIEPGVGYWVLCLDEGTISVGSGSEGGIGKGVNNSHYYSLYGEYPPEPPSSRTLTTPKQFELSQNYPNPFNSATNIEYSLIEEADVKLTVYNLLGQQVRTLVDKRQSTGYYTTSWDATDDSGIEVPAGVYFYRLEVGDRKFLKRMLYIK